mmetsp:Transcript_6135/g.14810  ORF Transcript_6135/g.14810 Transcript_6135/m.14810 type:complete len:156 (-) Transcript_6135:166-633(-)
MAIYGLPYTDQELLMLQNISLPGWLALALFPKNKSAQGFASLISVTAGIVFVATLGTTILEGKAAELGLETFTDLNLLCEAMSKPHNMLPAWLHYVAFDLLAGVWICQDVAKRDFPHILLLPVLLFTMLLGPSGLVLYCILRLPFNANRPKGKTS